MSEPSARERFVEMMGYLYKAFGDAPGAGSIMRQAVEAFADAECGLRERGGLRTVGWMRQHKGDGHTACRAALIKEVFGE